MRKGTLEILDCLKRQRSVEVTRRILLDLVKDIDDLPAEDFVSRSLQHVGNAKPRNKRKISTPADALRSRMSRYQKQSGLPMQRFLSEAAEHLWSEAVGNPSKASLKSAPSFLKAARKEFDDDKIEASLSEILKRYF